MRTIVFDLDGTILDSRERHSLLLRDILDEINIFVDPQKLNDYLKYKSDGYSTKKFLVDICKLSYENADICSKIWISRIENREYILRDELYPGVKEVLEYMLQKYKLILLTARRDKRLLEYQLKKFDIHKTFNEIICVNPLNAKEEKKTAVSNLKNVFVYFGDTEVDYNAAIKNNVLFCAMDYGFRSKLYWNKKGIITYSDLKEAIKKYNI